MAAQPLAARSARMKNGRALGGRKTRKLQFLERSGRDRRDFNPASDRVRTDPTPFTKPSVRFNLAELQIEKFQSQGIERVVVRIEKCRVILEPPSNTTPNNLRPASHGCLFIRISQSFRRSSNPGAGLFVMTVNPITEKSPRASTTFFHSPAPNLRKRSVLYCTY